MSARPSSSSTTHAQHIAPTVPQPVHALAIPTPTLIDSQLPQYLLPCVLDLVKSSTSHVIRGKRQKEDELRAEGLIPALEKGKGRADEGDAALIDEEAMKKIERMGLMVGGYIAERLTLARPPLASHLDIIKFVCKDLFLYVYSKQIDNLRTNHRGIFVLQSHAFPPLIPLSSHRGQTADMEAAKAVSSYRVLTSAAMAMGHLIFPQALVQGALGRLGMQASVIAESAGLPQCTFQIRTLKSFQPGTPSVPTPALSTPGQGGPPRAPVSTGTATTGLGIAGA